MAPHQKHYRTKMQARGWLDAAGQMVWPKGKPERETMARGIFGIEWISGVDGAVLRAEDELDDTHTGPGAGLEKPPAPGEAQRRAVFKTLTFEQREAVRQLVRAIVIAEFRDFCVSFDRLFGGSTISIDSPVDDEDEDDRLEIHSPSQDELHLEQADWLEEFSIVFGKGKREVVIELPRKLE